MEKIYRIVELLHKYNAGKLTAEEREELEEWLSVGGHRIWAEEIFSEEHGTEVLKTFRSYHANKAYQRFMGKQNSRRMGIRWGWVAALVLPVVVSMVVFLRNEIMPSQHLLCTGQDISVGGSRAILTLSTGKTVVLGKNQPVYTCDTNGVCIKADSSNLVYERKTEVSEVLVYNELTVPRRGEFALQLADGTKVYLNAESHLKYPETFGKNCREVELSGEAYFEVSRDTLRPFFVKVGDMRIRVLGTVFNINAYRELAEIKTTLVQGKVEVECQGKNVILFPGEQACLYKSDVTLHKEKVNVALYTAWKDGFFKFERERLEDIMVVLQRWYDVNVFFRNDALRESLFSGDLKKYDSIEEHLRMLELTTNISFQINNNVVFIGYKQ